ncbi:glycosyltransferase involved in cell wall biosynthesis [Silvibacterium bohemicum]|uniref:Glycosyltransferase involved in cell wall biosynthesis n=1 Tax=Silvibacterium bohemicum TaxID=1577686 RepID=A0A841K1E9_9BACT|nr:glycosyltransferase [Silvibacterium bohemicum]MBB6145779.1 glycosyltransferase involved in cell wall biosynthesis [Silvibacterium bohemicum]
MVAPRVAYFPDSYHEINGVAHTSRQFEAFARRRKLPFLCIRAGKREPRYVREEELTTLELSRGLLSFALEKDLSFDPGYLRHLPAIVRTLREFRPDIIHITGPSENGMLAAGLADYLNLPLAASWHTNVHEYAAQRANWFVRRLPASRKQAAADTIEHLALLASARFYALARILFAPNLGLCRLLERHTSRPCYLMQRGVDTQLFSPAHRDRSPQDTAYVLGFVGRLSIEKNVALLATVQQGLTALGLQNFRFCIVGHGAEEAWLRQKLPGAEFTGVLRGEALARAYANMDIFVFPSHTDTFGNVVLEALASGVPAIVTPDGGPSSIIREGETGLVARDEDFAAAAATILRDPHRHRQMRIDAREHARHASWDSVFEAVYAGYRTIL